VHIVNQGDDVYMPKINVDGNRCPQNHSCPAINICPVGAISQEGFDLPQIDHKKCILCRKCTTFCPKLALQYVEE
jgi:Fe-S-cluster-containing hydrogenase component 2